MKYVYLENLGCAKNQVDAETMLAQLEKDGFRRTEDVGGADLIIVNTCAFIESAREQSIQSFFSLLKQRKDDARVVVSGCLSQRYAGQLASDLPEASAIFGNRDLSGIGEVVSRVLAGERVVSVPDYPQADHEVYERNELLSFPGSAYLKISEGCNHRCAFCAIPLIRGSLRSRPMDHILDEARTLIARGIVEINLIAQDLASYGTDRDDHESRFMDLLSHLVDLDGDFVIRLLYIHPDAFPPSLPQFVKEHPKVLPYFDIPFQHASRSVLKSMGRAGSRERYLKLLGDIRAVLPEAVIRSTLMVGYPGEDAEAFGELEEFVKAARLDWMGSFVYSREEGTVAYGLRSERDHQAIARTAEARQERLEKLQLPITEAALGRYVGNRYPVLIEERMEGEDLYIGRIYAQAPEVDGLTVVMGHGLVAGSVVSCGIRAVNGLDLEAIPLEEDDG